MGKIRAVRVERADIYQSVTDSIIQAIEAGAGEWRMPWHRPGGVQPINVSSRKFYRGINTLALWVSSEINGFGSSVWGTYKQWREIGAQVQAGSRGTQIVFWKTLNPGESEGEENAQGDRDKPRFVARGFTVFNSAQVDGFDHEPVHCLSEIERVNVIDEFVAATGARIEHGGGRAYYAPQPDRIQMPPLNYFEDVIPYYGTLLHELTHWSGAKHRLDRTFGDRFGDQAYAFEELVAELGAAYLCSSLGITVEVRRDHAQYIESWLKVLKHDKRAIFTAASLAQKATDFLYGFQPEAQATGIEDHEDEIEPIAVAA
jgi:antirestriction protein ArdC